MNQYISRARGSSLKQIPNRLMHDSPRQGKQALPFSETPLQRL